MLNKESRYLVRKRHSFKMTQNTFDKMWRRLPVALEYKFFEDKLDIYWSTSQTNLRPLGALEGSVSFCLRHFLSKHLALSTHLQCISLHRA